jgi:hypothetical protein
VKGEVLLVGSSYGGAVITGVDRASVIRLVYVAAVMPTANDSVFATLGGACWPEFTAGIHPVEGGLFGMDLEVGVHRAFQQADAAAHDEWRGHAKSMSFGADLGLAVGRAGWERTPSTYVVCSEDLSVKPEQQRVWAQERATEMLEFPFDHSPGVSHPAEMADVIARLAAG